MAKRILIIEDNADLARLLAENLHDQSYEVDSAASGPGAMAMAERTTYDLIILDLTLPGIDGFEISCRIREKTDYVPIIMITSHASETDRVVGFEMGADDYLTKPFSTAELIARIKAIFRRIDRLRQNCTPATSARIESGDLVIDPQRREVTLEGNPVMLTAKEFDLLYHFAGSPGRVFTRAQLLDAVWGYSHDGYEHTVNSHINRLRAKIEQDPEHPQYILTVRGVGYKFADRNTAETGK